MDRNTIIEYIGQEIHRLEQVKELLNTTNGHGHFQAGAVKSIGPKKRILSADARNRIAQAQKRRWAKQRREAALTKKAS